MLLPITSSITVITLVSPPPLSRTCLDPAPGISSGDIWVPDDVLTWPICREDINANSSESHLTCEVTSAPCCFGIQANCLVTTREMCDFLEGRFNQDAFLCSQVGPSPSPSPALALALAIALRDV